MRKLILLFFLGIIVSLSSCRKDFDTSPNLGGLEFSKQTVYLDTVFTNIGSSTYMLKVYNRSGNDITIPSIRLGKGDSSKYRIMVDGMTGNNGKGQFFSNVDLLAKDSLFVFIETTASILDANPADFLYTDEIFFDSATGTAQAVNLVTLIQDAVFLYPEKDANGNKETLNLGVDQNGDSYDVIGFELDESDPIHGNELIFTNEKPYVIYGYAGVASGKTLEVQPGARVHFHADSGIIVKEGGSINVNGTPPLNADNPLENEVIFEGDRLEPFFSDVPGQWLAVWLMPGSVNNRINHLTLKNAVVGLLVEGCPLTITNSQIYNSANVGLLARAATVNGDNVVINLAGTSTLACSYGGSYQFRHCTFNNNWNSSQQLSVLLSNYIQYADGSEDTNDLQQANFYNCIIYGYNRVQLFFDRYEDDDSIAFNTDFNHCLIKFNDDGTVLQNDPLYDQVRLEAISNNSGLGNFLNLTPGFYNQNANKLNISPQSEGAFQKANSSDPYFVATDILGNMRNESQPDIGAYNATEFPQ